MAAAKPPASDPTELELGLPEPPPADIPDLSLRPEPPARAGRAAPTQSGIAILRGGLDDELEDPVAPAEIAIAEPVTRQAELPLPSGETPDDDALDVGPFDIDRAARFGPPPSSWLLSPGYAVRVLRRRRELRGATATLAQQLESAEDERDAALDEAARARWTELEADGRFGELLTRARDADREAAAASEALAKTNSAYGDELRRLDAARADLDRRRLEALTVEQQREAEQTQRERGLERAEARLQRLGIEQRNARRLQEEAAQADSPTKLPEGHEERMAELATQIPELLAEVDRHRALFKEASAQSQQARAETQRLTRELAAVEAERRSLESHFAKEASSRSASLGSAERERRRARGDIARALLRTELGASLAESDLERLRAHDGRVRQAARERLAHGLALDAFDRSAYRTGLWLLGSGALLLLLAIVLLLGTWRGCGGDPGDPRNPDRIEDEQLHGRLAPPVVRHVDAARRSRQGRRSARSTTTG